MKSIPSPWAQAFPRAIGLEPDGFLVPAATLRHLLARENPPGLIYTGFNFNPVLPNEGRFRACPDAEPESGDLILCDIDGWADLRRVVGRCGDGTLVTALDAYPEGRAIVPRRAVLGIVTGVPGAGGRFGRLAARLFPVWSRVGAFLDWWHQIAAAPIFGDIAPGSVLEKYGQQAKAYTAMLDLPVDPDLMALLRGQVSPGGGVLVAGSGAGGEALQLTRAGYRVTGVDFSPAMVEEARENARVAGIEIEFLEADIVTLDLAERRFEAIYATPLVYSFIARRDRRVTALRRCGRHLAEGGIVVFSAALYRGRVERLQALLGWVLRRSKGAVIEVGDWYTRFLTPQGKIGTSFLRLFSPREIVHEAHLAGFERIAPMGRARFVASGFMDEDA